ncbi:TetR/AcrR family transcriptional regulator [Leptolyngbya sp. Heron Island J]|uniref:TetR/AcrR family transcriptional regulator n=1 Tax=Leptolyngbya sp. Heron Island J TaxID=1385935 RepID=UPI0003F600D2|nr:TetR/AcrR family transcriptional regulator [Leptolyngbya sp. Heron Island J]
MSKAQVTREHIIQQAAVVFNQQGYAGTSMSDIMQATGLKKGGIYNHFKSKDDLAVAAFDFSVGLVQTHYTEALRGQRHAIVRLRTMVAAFCSLMANPPTVKGGCPILNTAIESDDTHPTLRRQARQAMDNWQRLLAKIITLGIKHQQVDASTDPEAVATVIISTLEGGLMMTQLYGAPDHLRHAQQHLLDYIETLKI